MLTFMDIQTYDQIELEADFVGDRAQFLQDGMKVMVQLHEGRPHRNNPAAAGRAARRRGRSRDQGADRGVVVQSGDAGERRCTLVPPFIEAGTRVIVSTDDGPTSSGRSRCAYLSPALNVMMAAARKAAAG